MSLEVFEKLESKVQQAIDTITLLQMEIEELKEKNVSCRGASDYIRVSFCCLARRH